MFVLVTDFGASGPYVGQMMAVLHEQGGGRPVVSLFSDAPAHNPRATAYLLAAYAEAFPEGSTFLGIVDPGVGTGEDRPVIVNAGNRWFVGPDNGLFHTIAKRYERSVRWWEITWRPERLSASFHGRDLYAPVAARLASGDLSVAKPMTKEIGDEWPDDLYEIVYIDHFGNAITGVRASVMRRDAVLEVNGEALRRATTFASVPLGDAFWYENSNGLVEFAVNQGRAAEVLGLAIGDRVGILT